MRSASVCPETGLRKGSWTQEEDRLLSAYIKRYGLWNWREIPKYAGLSRCGKSCRLRWMNYLRPDIKRGNFTTEEDEIITNHIQKFGQRWSLIAARLPGRTDNEVKNHWHTSLKKQNPSAALKEVKRVKSAKSRRALNNSCDPLSLSSLILESSAVVPLSQQCSSDSSVSVSDSEAAIVENQAIQECEMLLDTNVNFLGESSTEPILLEYVEQKSGASTVATSDLSEEFPTETILLEEAHLWDNNSSNWIDSLLSDPFPLIEEALCAYNLSSDYSMDFLFSQ